MGDNTFQTIAEHSLPVPSLPVVNPSRRPLPNLISSFLPAASSILPASLRSSSSSTSTPSNPEPVASKPPAMKRPRGGQGLRRVVDTHTPVNGLPLRRDGRDLKDIEPNGEEGVVRRSTRLKAVPTKPMTKVSFRVTMLQWLMIIRRPHPEINVRHVLIRLHHPTLQISNNPRPHPKKPASNPLLTTIYAISCANVHEHTAHSPFTPITKLFKPSTYCLPRYNPLLGPLTFSPAHSLNSPHTLSPGVLSCP
jgi:hypothetical protein